MLLDNSGSTPSVDHEAVRTYSCIRIHSLMTDKIEGRKYAK